MRVTAKNGDYLSIENVEIDAQRVGIQLAIQIRQGDFAGAARVWVQVRDWERFVESLARLERDRHGEAVVEAMSPGELLLKIRATDRLGHVAVEGLVGQRGVERTTALSFSAIDFDPTLLPDILWAAREIAR
jgi:hypothetical protein